ncbi:hypothetical protein QE152_g15863 [Popillia japonica]|uniref:Uncharacterized protein n=1 Tax=Popillia japonica TaxID=7064 RepID=A0AAW1L6N5_POPJA
MKKIELTLDICEKDKKKNNIIIKELPIDTTDGNMLKSTMINFVNKEMGVKVEIRQARKINDRTCVIQLDTFEQKLSVLKNKKNLRRLDQQVYIKCDLTLKEIEMQKHLKFLANAEKNNGGSVKVGYSFLVIDGTKGRWNRRDEKLEKEKGNRWDKREMEPQR